MTEEAYEVEDKPVTLPIESVLAAAIVGSPDGEIFIPNDAIERNLQGKVITINYDPMREGYVLAVEDNFGVEEDD